MTATATPTATPTAAPRAPQVARLAAESSSTSPLLKLVHTSDDRVATLLRLALGIVMLPHAAQKCWAGSGATDSTERLAS